ncbi:MAG: hypothetical protein ACM3SU_07235 [Acidobacteriota bacterium]
MKHPLFFSAAALSIAAAAGARQTSRPEEAAMFRADPRHTGVVRTTAIPDVSWVEAVAEHVESALSSRRSPGASR